MTRVTILSQFMMLFFLLNICYVIAASQNHRTYIFIFVMMIKPMELNNSVLAIYTIVYSYYIAFVT